MFGSGGVRFGEVWLGLAGALRFILVRLGLVRSGLAGSDGKGTFARGMAGNGSVGFGRIRLGLVGQVSSVQDRLVSKRGVLVRSGR